MNALGRALSLIARKHETARLAQCAGAVAIALTLSAAPASATNIERIVSPGGIEAWLVHETAVPLITVDFAFDGGGAQDPAGKAGTANLMASLLDEGAGDLDANAFQSGSIARPCRCIFAPAATTSAARCRRCRKTATKRSTICGWR